MQGLMLRMYFVFFLAAVILSCGGLKKEYVPFGEIRAIGDSKFEIYERKTHVRMPEPRLESFGDDFMHKKIYHQGHLICTIVFDEREICIDYWAVSDYLYCLRNVYSILHDNSFSDSIRISRVDQNGLFEECNDLTDYDDEQLMLRFDDFVDSETFQFATKLGEDRLLFQVKVEGCVPSPGFCK